MMVDVSEVISRLLDEKNWETLTGVDAVPAFVMDAVVLLKSQQARIERMEVERTPSVVTLDVIQGRKLDVLWLEHRSAGSHPFDPTAVEPAIYYCMDVQGNMFFSCGCGTLRFDSDDYGWYWRCWTARPSEEMKKEVKWQEPTDEWDGDGNEP